MRKVLIILIASMVPAAQAETVNPLRIKPVCGNFDNGIVVGKPKLFDDRTLALRIRSLQARVGDDAELALKLAALKALAERALSDRVLLSPSRTGARAAARAQMLVEFQISIDPKEKYANSVAEVEIAVSSRGDLQQPPVLVSQIPKERTYKDTEIVALEKFTPSRENRVDCATGFAESARDLTFAWQLRPALGHDQVDPGTHEIYALLALPTTNAEDYVADIHVHTSWRPLKKLRHKSAMEFLETSSRDELWTEAIRFNPAEMELTLRPRVTGTRFIADDPNNLVVVVEGEHFLLDTSVMLGKTALSGEKLSIEQERHLQFSVPAVELLKHDLFLSGAPLLDPRAQSQENTSDPSWGLKIEYARAHPKDAEDSEVRIKLKSRQRKHPVPDMIVNNTLVGTAGRVFTVSNLETEPTDSDAVLLRFDVPTAALRKAPHVTVARVFGGDRFRDSADLVLEDDISAHKVSVLAETGDEVTFLIAGSGFTNMAVVQLAGVTYTRWTKPGLLVSGSSMITLKVKRALLDGVKELAISQGFAQPLILELPELPHHRK